MRHSFAPALLLASLIAAAPAAAQDDSRWTIGLGGGLLTTSDGPTGASSFDHPLFGDEQGEFNADYAGGDASHYELSVGVRLRDRLALGVTWSESSVSDDAAIMARLPHPLYYDAHRTLEASSGSLSRDETALHLSLKWTVHDGEALQVGLFGGPSQIELTHDLVSAIRFEQAYPFDEVTYEGADIQSESGDAVGYHVGADVVYWFGETFGLGFLVRFSGASVDLNAPNGESMSVDVGGLQGAVDLRVRF